MPLPRLRTVRGLVATLLSSIIVLLSPGLAGYRAFGQATPASVAVGANAGHGVLAIPYSLTSSFSLASGIPGSSLNSLSLSGPELGSGHAAGLSLASPSAGLGSRSLSLASPSAGLGSGSLSRAATLGGLERLVSPAFGIKSSDDRSGPASTSQDGGGPLTVSASVAREAKVVTGDAEAVRGDLAAAQSPASDASGSSWSLRRIFDKILRRASPSAVAPATDVSGAALVSAGGAEAALRPSRDAAADAKPAAGVPVPAVKEGGRGDASPYYKAELEKAEWGLMLERLFGLASLSIGMVAYPLFVISAVGAGHFLVLSAIGAVVGVPLAILAGKVGDLMPLKKYTLFNIDLRAGISVAQAVFYAMDWLSFGSLLFLTILSTWQFQTLFSNTFALQAELTGPDKNKVRATEAKIRMATIFTTVGVSLFLSAPLVRELGFFWIFMLTGAIQLLSHPALHWALPSHGRMIQSKLPSWAQAKAAVAAWFRTFGAAIRRTFVREPKPSDESASAGRLRAAAESFGLKKLVLSSTAVALATFAFFVPIPLLPFLLYEPVPLVAIAGAIIWQMKGFQLIKSNPLVLASLGFVLIGAFIEVPLRGSALGVISTELAKGTAEAAAMLGALVAAFYLGQLPSGTGMLEAKQTVMKKLFGGQGINFRNMMKWIGGGVVAWWMAFVLLPKGVLAAGVASAAAFAASIPMALAASIAIPATLLGLMIAVGLGLSPTMNPNKSMLKSGAFVAGALAAGALVWQLPALAAALLAAPSAILAWGSTAALAAAVMAGYFALHKLSPKLSDSRWMLVEAGALAFMTLPLFFWGQPWALYLSLAVFGFALNGSQRMVSATFSAETKKAYPDQFQFINGIRQAFFGITTAVAYSIQALSKKVPALWGGTSAYPFTWYVIAAIYLAFAVAFVKGSRMFETAKAEQAKIPTAKPK
ncbi:MAG: hypothetical protein HY078_10230 [Elusimicrobia bacterium]|nr:hypothetical protein [Elusimicrobiota bacterium]